MKLFCDQNELARYLQTVVRAVSSKLTLPILTGILIETIDNSLHCVATDLELAIEINIPNVQIIEPGKAVVSGKTFVEIVRHLPSGPIEISQSTTDNMVHISGKNASFQLPIFPVEDFPALPELDESTQFTINGLKLKEGIKQTVYATLADDPRPFLSSVLWEITAGQLKLVATDVNRLAVKSLAIEANLNNQILVPVRAMRELATIFGNNAEEELTIALSNRVVLIKGLGISFSTRLVEAQFPQYEQVIPKEFNGSLKIQRSELIAALERSVLISNSIRLKISDEQMEITAAEPDKGHCFEIVPANISGSSLVIGFNIRFLLEFMKIIENETVIIQYSQSQKPVLLQGEGTFDYQYVVMPLKLSV